MVAGKPIDPMQFLRHRGFKLYFVNREAAESMIRQMEQFEAFFTPQGERPWIIDCGANIGVSVLEWKARWPQAEILCFEPDPAAFACLQRTIDANRLAGVRCVAAAVSDQEGPAAFYGEVGPRADARGNSLEPAWGDRRHAAANRAGVIEVPCHRLSRYLGDRRVSFLKLDVEGAEHRVFRDIASQLRQIDALYVEIHQTRRLQSNRWLRQMLETLQAAGLQVDPQARHAAHALPPEWQAWQQAEIARQTHLLAWR